MQAATATGNRAADTYYGICDLLQYSIIKGKLQNITKIGICHAHYDMVDYTK